MILVTGGAGFTGSNFILDWSQLPVKQSSTWKIFSACKDDSRHVFAKGDINDRKMVTKLLDPHKLRAIDIDFGLKQSPSYNSALCRYP